ncbi:extracellular solute-binding protein [Paenibacillus sp. N1-5-1-14]|uniref:extracellular solute-binding protein n=1 Tax=Paenibacillus radicibacter TaxID=2972488 RepID=UPI002158E639|nr:extracellular solute-binding protein [Paenibacillus radicibacter]MCR8642693.1 extracellular solute-binding protein [Paenibacillus radicibacter]
MKVKKWGSMVLTSVLSVTMLAACSGGTTKDTSSSPNPAPAGSPSGDASGSGFPISKDKITINAFAGKFISDADWNTIRIWQEYEKMTNVHINWETVQKDNLKEKRNLMLAGGNYPEIFYASSFPKADLIKYGKQGAFLPLNDLIDKQMPNFKKILEKYPSIKKAITMPDGNIYSIPTLFDPEFKSVLYGTPWVKKPWLDKLQVKEPTNLDEFYAMLKAFKENDANGNGQKDEIAWGGTGTNGILSYLKGAYGLNNRGLSNANVDSDPATGKIRFVPADPKYKELLQYVNKLYNDGLIEKDIVTVKSSEIDAKGMEGKLGIVDNVAPEAIYNQNDYVGLPVLKGPHGDQMNTAVYSPVWGFGNYVLTDKNKHPEQSARWVDYFFSPEGTKMFFMGWKGETYNEDASGNVDYVDDIKKNPNGLNLDQAVGRYLIWPGGLYPGFVTQKYFKGAEGLQSSVDNAKKSEAFSLTQDKVWPSLNFTAEEQAATGTVQNDINTYVTEMQDKFIIGQVGFDKWDEYVATLNKMGLEKYVKTYQTALDRYSSVK